VQEASAGVYYNTLVTLPTQQVVKYGVISTKRLLADLHDWTSLYVSGRMHKPVAILQSDTAVIAAATRNLHSAVACSMLLLPRTFSERQLYMTIAGLSYTGDVRMGLAENPKKVENIVSANHEHFHRLYQPTIQDFCKRQLFSLSLEQQAPEFTQLSQDIPLLLSSLPANLQTAIAKENSLLTPACKSSALLVSSLDQGASSMAGWRGIWEIQRAKQSTQVNKQVPSAHTWVRKGLGSIVNTSSKQQSFKGIFTAGVTKSTVYALAKVAKAFKGR
jgi:translocator assembly and maintenance protein 41